MSLRARGHTLIELLIAVSLSVIVLMAVFGVMTSMFRFQVEGLKKSTVTGWSLASLMKMNKEIESASVMAYPTDTTPRDWIVGCTNWSRILATGKADNNQNVVVFYYCYDGAANGTIRRLARESSGTTCPTSPLAPPGICTDATTIPGSGTLTNDVIAVGVNRHSTGSPGVFTRDNGVGGVRVRYTVGEKTFVHVDGKPDVVNPQYMEFDTGITMSRAYLNTND